MKATPQPSSSKNIVELKIVEPVRGRQKEGAVKELSELFRLKLKNIYWLENNLVRLIPKIIRYTKSMELVNALEIHLEVTKDQVRRLNAVFESIQVLPSRLKCSSASGILKHVNEELEITGETMVRDAGIILAVQQLIHYNIALFGSLSAFANVLGEYEAAVVLSNAGEEEKKSDRDLSQIAETFINPVAAGGYSRESNIPLNRKVLLN